MHIIIDHFTRYSYSQPATGIIQLLRVTPRADDNQQILRWRIDVDADGRLIPFTDSHGNFAHSFYADGAVAAMTIHVSGEVVTSDSAGIVSGAVEPLHPLIYQRQTALTRPSPAIIDLANASDQPNRVARAHAMVNAIADRIAFDTSATYAATPAADAFAAGRGVCQDMAQILIAAARHAGYPARYVSGHYAAPDHPEQEAAHAWAELWIEELGWVGFDPTHRVCSTEGHVRVAVGHDALDASPVRGSRRGGGEEMLSVEVRGHENPRSRFGQTQEQKLSQAQNQA